MLRNHRSHYDFFPENLCATNSSGRKLCLKCVSEGQYFTDHSEINFLQHYSTLSESSGFKTPLRNHIDLEVNFESTISSPDFSSLKTPGILLKTLHGSTLS